MNDAVQQAKDRMSQADLLYSAEQVEAALDHMAVQIQARLADSNPLVLAVMVGGLVTTGKLLTRLNFPMQLDYLHVSRYGAEMSGGTLTWLAQERHALKDRVVLVVDDIFDAGLTLDAIMDYCRQQGVKEAYSAVLLEKQRQREVQMRPDFAALMVEDRYLFGYGLDCKGYHRNAAGIYAVKGT